MFSSFLPYRNSKRLRDFEKIEISSKAAEVTVNNKRKALKTFVWISFKNSASVLRVYRDNYYHAWQQYWDTIRDIRDPYQTGEASVRGSNVKKGRTNVPISFWKRNQNVLVLFLNFSYWKQVLIFARICSPGPNRKYLFRWNQFGNELNSS